MVRIGFGVGLDAQKHPPLPVLDPKNAGETCMRQQEVVVRKLMFCCFGGGAAGADHAAERLRLRFAQPLYVDIVVTWT
jgi:hypothetical protein